MLSRADEEARAFARRRETRRAHPRRRSVPQPIWRRWFRLIRPFLFVYVVHHDIVPLALTSQHQSPQSCVEIGARRVAARSKRPGFSPRFVAVFIHDSMHPNLTVVVHGDDVHAFPRRSTLVSLAPRVRVDDFFRQRQRRRRARVLSLARGRRGRGRGRRRRPSAARAAAAARR